VVVRGWDLVLIAAALFAVTFIIAKFTAINAVRVKIDS
jgi:hypothetical protein